MPKLLILKDRKNSLNIGIKNGFDKLINEIINNFKFKNKIKN